MPPATATEIIRLQNPLPGSRLSLWPRGDIRQLYGANPKNYGGIGHTGLDLALVRGSSVVVAHDGTVQTVRTNAEYSPYGNFVTVLSPIYPGGWQILTQYAHLLAVSVKVDQPVRAGDLLGLEGNSGYVVSNTQRFWGNAPANLGNHLHFNVFLFKDRILVPGLNGMNTVDPLPFLTPTMALPLVLRDGEQFIQGDKSAEIRLLGQRELHTLIAHGLLEGNADPSLVARKPVLIIGDDE